ncbi:DUF456 domain-containing protein [Cohnella thermotolerans]|jgi:uncharacterized protein YqgC (DUF456 family)|uniref:DUF456 domain-containing protein n=1 Tax=Cohnella thermotolerans TaxID=329858 RepID=UPI0003F61686|nr:DUF456 family protein [Cohnella thermotolerans]
MELVGWIVVVLLFAIGMAGTVYPVLPGAIAIYAAFFAYGLFMTFHPFGFWFWTIETLIVIVLFVADYAVSAWGVKKFGGSKASVVGSTIGIMIGPFLIPAFGLIIGPFAGAVLGELVHGSSMDRALKVGWGSMVGLFTSTVVKIVLQLAMIAIFVIWLIVH